MIFLKLLYLAYWIVLGVIIWRYEKKIAWLEEEKRHLKETLDIVWIRDTKKPKNGVC